MDTLVSQARAQLAEHGFVKLTSLAPKSLRDTVISELVQHGFERTKSGLRVPLATQLQNAVAHGALVSLSALPSHVLGATKAELKAAVKAALGKGIVVRVLRGPAESIVAVGAAVLTPQAVDALAAQLGGVLKSLEKARKSGGLTLLSADVRAGLEQALHALPTAPKKLLPVADLESVLQTVDSVRDSKTGLSFIPHVVAQLSKTMSEKAATEALLKAAATDLLELRPEGGLARLSQAELALCPAGPQGTRLSWARRLSGGTT